MKKKKKEVQASQVDKNELVNLLDLCQKSSALAVTVINNDSKIKIQATSNGIDINCTQELNSTDTAKRYNQSARWLNDLLFRNGVHRRIDGIWQFETKYADKGYATIDSNGTKYWTSKGRKLIDNFARAEGFFPINEKVE